MASRNDRGEREGRRTEGVPGGDPGSPLSAFSPEAALGLWAAWMKGHVDAATGRPGDPGGLAPWLMPAGAGPESGLGQGPEQLVELLAKDPMLASIDRMWNANPLHDIIPVDWAEVVRALRVIWLRRMADPGRAVSAMVEFNARTWHSAVEAWNGAASRWMGLAPDAAAQPGLGAADKRFDAPDWHTNPVYRTLKDVYLLASDFLLDESAAADFDPEERERLRFHLQQFVNATSPTLMLLSNPAALHRAMETGGGSVADGLRNLMSDLKAGRLTMVDADAFAPGRNLAVTPGKVVLRNRLIELIQYAPQTEQVHAVPLLFLPPWINKFYILDMQPKNSFVRYLVEQGFTVFIVSWKNPDSSMEDITFDDYMRLGPLAAAAAVQEITGSRTVSPIGYCIGGTLLVATLAWLAAKGREEPFGTATFMVSLQDFAKVGETSLFMGEASIDYIEQQMMERGYLDSREMSAMFNLLRSNDLIWANVVNNYLMGRKPPAFDLLYWNSDGTRMSRTAHSWYLRNTYVENNLVEPGKVELGGERLDLGKIKQDVYAVGAEKDHIVPWYAAWRITQLTGGKVRFVMASSGHIAGIINHPGPRKGAYWVSEKTAETPEAWLKQTEKRDGSWWTDWIDWLRARSGERVKPPGLGSRKHPPLADAPGAYVMEK